MTPPDLSDLEADVLRTVHVQEGADLYDLARAVGTGPRAVQVAVQGLVQHDLVHVSERGVRVRCTGAGHRWVRGHS